MLGALGTLADDPRVRLLVLRGKGKNFQAGADLAWLKRVAGFALEDNVAFSRRTTRAMCGLNEFPVPTIALVHGACYGGGVGMVACCDVRIATETAAFALSEVRWGVIPAPIIPQLCAAMGVSSLRRYGITGERFDAHEARRIGLIHEVCAEGGLDRAAEPIVEAVLRSAPEAVRETKRLALAEAGLEAVSRTSRRWRHRPRRSAPRPKPPKASRAFKQKRDAAWYRPPEKSDKLGGHPRRRPFLFLPGPAMTR